MCNSIVISIVLPEGAAVVLLLPMPRSPDVWHVPQAPATTSTGGGPAAPAGGAMSASVPQETASKSSKSRNRKRKKKPNGGK